MFFLPLFVQKSRSDLALDFILALEPPLTCRTRPRIRTNAATLHFCFGILPRTTAVLFVPVGMEAARSPRPSLYREDQASTARGKSTSTVGGHVGPSGAETVFAR